MIRKKLLVILAIAFGAPLWAWLVFLAGFHTGNCIASLVMEATQ